MAVNNTDNVSIGKPKQGGAVYFADYGCDVPTNAVDDLPDDFINIGYVSDEGLTESQESSSESVVAWGGDTVAQPTTEYSKSYTFAMIETSTDSLKLAWGADNVTEDDDGMPIVNHTTKPRQYVTLAIDYDLGNDLIKRTVVPKAQVSEVDDITYVDGEPVAYGLTVNAFPVNSSVAIDYYAKAVSGDDSGTNMEP